MKTKYYAWKDGKKLEGKQGWVELTPSDFIKICNNNRELVREERRYFYQLPRLEEGDNYLYLECTYEQFLVSRAEKDERTRRRKEKEALIAAGKWYVTVSLDSPFEDESGNTCTLHDEILDFDADFEDHLVMSMDLHNALETLHPDERDLIYDLFFDPDGSSIRKLAKQKEVSYQALNAKRLRIFKKLEKRCCRFEFFPTNRKVRGQNLRMNFEN